MLFRHEMHHTPVFKFREHVDIHMLAVAQVRERMERYLTRRLFTSHFIKVVTGYFEQSARHRKVHIINAKVAFVALDRTFKNFMSQFHRFAIDALHRHRRPLDKRPLLRNACHIQILDSVDTRIIRRSTRNLFRACRKHGHKGKRQCESKNSPKKSRLVSYHSSPPYFLKLC